jgi:hypothetical protein
MSSPGIYEVAVEEATLSWFDDLGYSVAHGELIALRATGYVPRDAARRQAAAIDRLNSDIGDPNGIGAGRDVVCRLGGATDGV